MTIQFSRRNYWPIKKGPNGGIIVVALFIKNNFVKG